MMRRRGVTLSLPLWITPLLVLARRILLGWNLGGRLMFEDADEAIARVEDDVRRAQARAERLPALQAAIDAIRVKASSQQRDLTVQVDSSGALVDLVIHDLALERGGARISREVLKLIATAAEEARAQTLEVSTEILGADDPILKIVATELNVAAEGSRAWQTAVPGER